jgi:hypothetical protein
MARALQSHRLQQYCQPKPVCLTRVDNPRLSGRAATQWRPQYCVCLHIPYFSGICDLIHWAEHIRELATSTRSNQFEPAQGK